MNATRAMQSGFLWLVMTASAAAATPAAARGMTAMRFFAGTWDCSGEFPASGKPIAATIRFDFDVGGAVLVKHHDDAPPGPYHAIEDWVARRDGHGFVAAIVDAYSGLREFDSPGWHGNALAWKSAANILPQQRFVYTRLDANSFRFDWEVSRDGSHYLVGDTLTCKRRARAFRPTSPA